ncbi:hypothetical protein SDC9_201359 [bioreactor metagenome]|uniref:Uncharacterized protein n=1 Tax=bioreactor metagenome TaxID=1076179 RepID=A0A645J2N1_9ZZZZ
MKKLIDSIEKAVVMAALRNPLLYIPYTFRNSKVQHHIIDYFRQPCFQRKSPALESCSVCLHILRGRSNKDLKNIVFYGKINATREIDAAACLIF